MRNYESALLNAEEALKLGPAEVDVLIIGGNVKFQSGQLKEGLELTKRAIRKYPHHPPFVLNHLGLIYLMLGKYPEADETFKSVLTSPNEFQRDRTNSLSGLVVTSAFKGNMDKAKQYFNQMLDENPNVTEKGLMRTIYWKDQEFLNRYFDVLRQFGLSE